jgi:hypothetical protein
MSRGHSEYDSDSPFEGQPSSAPRAVPGVDRVPPTSVGIGRRLRPAGPPRAFSQTVGQWKAHYRNLRLQQRAYRDPYYQLAMVGILAITLGILVIALILTSYPPRSTP